jgi:Conjugative transposon protein TcpC
MLFSKKSNNPKTNRRIPFSRKKATQTASILFFSVMFLSLLFNVIFFAKYQTIRNSVKASEDHVQNRLKKVENENLLYSDSIAVFTEDFLKYYLNVPQDEKAKRLRLEALSTYFVSEFDLKRLPDIKDFKGERQVTNLQYVDIKHVNNKAAKVHFKAEYEIHQQDKGKPKTTNYQTDIIVPVTSNGKGFAVYQNPNLVQEDLKSTMSYDKPSPDGEAVTLTETKEIDSFLNDFFTSYGVSDEKLPFMAKVENGLQKQVLQGVTIREAVKQGSIYKVVADVNYQSRESSISDLYTYELDIEKENNKFFITNIE